MECEDVDNIGKQEISKGKLSTVMECAMTCSNVSVLFIYGKRGGKTTSCDDEGCSCVCELSINCNGNCIKEKFVDAFDLYRYTRGSKNQVQFKCAKLLHKISYL